MSSFNNLTLTQIVGKLLVLAAFVGALFIFGPSESAQAALPMPVMQDVKCLEDKGEVRLQWGSVTGAQDYRWRLQRIGGTEQSGVTTNTRTWPSIQFGVNYEWWVHAWENGNFSDHKKVKFQCPKPPPPVEPVDLCEDSRAWNFNQEKPCRYETPPVPNMYSESFSSDAREVTLSWGNVSGADEYRVQIYETQNEDNTRRSRTVNNRNTSFSIKPGVGYTWIVRAYDEDMPSAYRQSSFNKETFAALPERPSMNPPECVDDGSRIELSWGAVNGAERYPVRLKRVNSSEPERAEDLVLDTNYSFSVTPGVEYEWWVHAWVDGAYSPHTKRQAGPCESSIEPDPKPVQPVMNNVQCETGNTSVTLSWGAVSGADYYPVRIAPAGEYASYRTAPGEWLEEREITFGNIEPGQRYEWWVHAYDESNQPESSKWSESTFESFVCQDERPARPVMLDPDFNSNGTEVTLRWQSVSGVSQYAVRIQELGNTATQRSSEDIEGFFITSTNYTFTGIDPDKVYEWWVHAYVPEHTPEIAKWSPEDYRLISFNGDTTSIVVYDTESLFCPAVVDPEPCEVTGTCPPEPCNPATENCPCELTGTCPPLPCEVTGTCPPEPCNPATENCPCEVDNSCPDIDWCLDDDANNTNDPAPCRYSCTDPLATNTGGDRPCEYPGGGCQDPSASNNGSSESCIYLCKNSSAENFNGPLPCMFAPEITISPGLVDIGDQVRVDVSENSYDNCTLNKYTAEGPTSPWHTNADGTYFDSNIQINTTYEFACIGTNPVYATVGVRPPNIWVELDRKLVEKDSVVDLNFDSYGFAGTCSFSPDTVTITSGNNTQGTGESPVVAETDFTYMCSAVDRYADENINDGNSDDYRTGPVSAEATDTVYITPSFQET